MNATRNQRGLFAHMRQPGIAVAIAVLATTACKEQVKPQAASTESQVPARQATFAQDSMRDFFIEGSVADVPGTTNDIISTFGEPDSIVRLPSANVQDPMKFDTVIELHYPGLSASILKVNSNEILQAVTVRDTIRVTGPIHVGTDTATLRRLLGGPLNIGGKPGYVCGRCSILNEVVQFDIANGQVAGMTFSFPVTNQN
jgi:hypothetical protein